MTGSVQSSKPAATGVQKALRIAFGVTMALVGLVQMTRGLEELGVLQAHGPMRVERAATTRDNGDETTTFQPTDLTIRMHADVHDAVAGTPATITWFSIDDNGQAEQLLESKLSLDAGDVTVKGFAKNSGPWPVGHYRVDLTLNGKTEQSVPFTVATR
jgi:hypothetical protein